MLKLKELKVRPKIVAIVLLGQLFFSVSALATKGENRCSLLMAEFQYRKIRKNKDPHCYHPGLCHANVLRLYKAVSRQLEEKDHDMRVLILFRPSFEEGLMPLKSSSFEMYQKGRRGWTYHVVLESAGRIYDLDYLDSSSSAPRIKDYFQNMFLNTGSSRFSLLQKQYLVKKQEVLNSFKNMEVIDMAAEKFLKSYEVKKQLGRAGMEYFLFGAFTNDYNYSESINTYLDRKSGANKAG